ncbi:single-stranded-DNA-specific exonuclease RecJ [soil metagenome]
MALAVPSTTTIWHDPPALSTNDLGITGWPLLSAILRRRGIQSRDEAARFLAPHEIPLGDPYLLPDMRQAVAMIQEAIESGETIAVFGDYDVDGISSTAMLTRALRRIGGVVVPRIPHRVNEGYGLNPGAVEWFADEGVRLLITVDCGSSDVAEIDLALARGMQVIVIDHHRVHHELPEEVAFVSPKRDENAYPESELATAGVAFTLIRALLGENEAEMFLPYAALATVADVVPLQGENRALVARGVDSLRRWTLPGFKTLCKVAGIDRRAIDAFDIGFIVGPRINAAGRMASPDLALDWFLADDIDSSMPLSQQLDRLNRERQSDTRKVLQEAELQIRLQEDGADQAALVVDGRDWNVGVVGIVAGRLAERFHRPTIVISRGPQLSTGSARTAGDVDIVDAIRSCRDLLERFGGHTAAAGLTIETSKIDTFRRALINAVLVQLDGETPMREIFLDAEVDHDDLSLTTVERLGVLEPCGHGNKRPLLLVRSLHPDRVRTSRDGKHLLFDVIDGNDNRHQATLFNAGERRDELLRCNMIDAAAELRRNTWNGRVSLQLMMTDFRPST